MNHLFLVLFFLFFPALAIAAPEECACVIFPSKQLLIYGCGIGAACIGGCWWTCRKYCLKIKCECNCPNLSQIQAEFEKLKEELQIQEQEL